MRVVLLQNVPKLGLKDDVVTVKEGFGLNFLIPNKKAAVASPSLVRQAEERRKKRVVKVEEALKNLQEIKDKLKGASLTFRRKTEGKKLFGSVSEKDLIDAVKEQCKVELTKEMLVMEEHIKDLGAHEVTVRLSPDISVALKIIVEAE
ncbi:50S ribosomal protein L9 [Candidatus Peregrinibacteria bacterium]|nr:50S ribosomal protein L9 [Candidatus Peregrinibacteria bacterium]